MGDRGQNPARAAKSSGDSRPKQDQDLIVVGAGASAGGLEALSDLLRALPSGLNMALVVVQHLDPRHESVLPDLLSGKTGMHVVQVQHESPIRPDHVYVISPNTILQIRNRRLVLETRPAETFKPIDIFFESLAEEFRNSAVGVVLSGTGTDGTLGLKRIKAEGGITFAQNQTARFDSMPRSAIAAGVVDFVLSPRQIAEELVALARRPEHLAGERPVADDGGTLKRVLVLLRKRTSVDFAQYKQPTIARRLSRRMVVRKCETLNEYFQVLQKEPGEVDALFDDLLINVTDFFRDPDVFEVAKRLAFPHIIKNRKQPHTIRAWIPACSTGEEVYSMAIALAEFLEEQDLGCTVQMFGTDVSERTIDKARKGVYAESAVLSVSPERLRRFFVRTDSGYQVGRDLREMCIFSSHNLAKDPPLSRMDLISCRNLLIYFSPTLQRKVMSTFSYALQPGGCLILGTSETLGSLADYFTVVDEQRRIYSRNTHAAPQLFQYQEEQADEPLHRSNPPIPSARSAAGREGEPAERYADQIVLSRYGPSGMVVDESLRIVSYRGDIDEFLIDRKKPGNAELMNTVREDLRAVLSATIEQARRTDALVVGESPPTAASDLERPVVITAIPLSLAGTPQHFLILLGREREMATRQSEQKSAPTPAPKPMAKSLEEENASLKQELKSTREYLQSVIEELRSTNEEVQSANEELQSTNEEMQTSKEELQSSNEELNTINAELQSRNTEMAQINDDLLNLLGSMNMAIVMTGRDLRIRRFTPLAEKTLRLIATDIGRPIADLKPRINVPDLEQVLGRVLETLQPSEREVEDQEGRSYLMRVRPYRTGDDRIDGTVLQLLDVSDLKRSLEEAKYARDFAEAIVNTIREPLAVLDESLVIRKANRAFCEAMELPEGAAAGKNIFEAAHGRFETLRIRKLFDQLNEGIAELNDVEIEPQSGRGEVRTLLVNARRLRSPDREELILMAFEDVTERKRAAEARYRRLFETARDGIVIVDAASGEIVDLNPFTERLLGHARGELVGRKLWEIEPIESVANIRGIVEQIRDRGVLRLDELTLRTKDGHSLNVEVIATMHTEGERRAIQLNMRDVSERKKFERELQETQKLESLGLLAGGIAHDFNNLLTGILGNASLALSDTPPEQPLRVRLREIVEAAERAGFLTRQMLAYAGRGRFVTAMINLSDLVREISTLVRTSIPKSVDVRLDLAPNPPPIEADPAQMQQVIMNLVINGAEAIGEKQAGTVTVRTSLREIDAKEATGLFTSEPLEPGMYVQLEVIDNGSGMDEATRGRIFDPFFTTKLTGRGLGLAAVQGIVRRHGGTIRVHSTPGHGTTFLVLIPAKSGTSSQNQVREAHLSSIPAGSMALVIDDERTVRRLAEAALSRKGMKVFTAENGKAGVESFRKYSRNLSVVILDLQMPVMGGEHALPLLREVNPKVPIILSSGFDESEAARKFSALKPVGFLQKPYTAERLVEAVSAVLRRKN
ncbi:MAG TPA: chemotaxis protein CheB [Bryobacteraceae bacterium]|nr:chemotaxis protein CheB [Bryobacteraceae bacterium]